ncbi:hypothetical protein EQ875_01621 [Photobacterium damselae subsp. damselae]|uniref:hypothetical protein n=1 Tax=Photobacterium damselae TaxID=38293 RepID=UPI00109BB4FF|nr:hypothetical protein [Photobacterium damselae]TGZ35340.1 hypothetical protein EQ875_01621 [Photobacterium damselae subsp. damselae]
MTAKLKGYTPKQRNLALSIRAKVIQQHPWGENIVLADRLKQELERITSPMFFIRYRAKLEAGNIADALSNYGDENYSRRKSFYETL